MSNASPFGDPSISSADILFRLDTWTQGRFLTSMVYGMGVLLFIRSFRLLLLKYSEKYQSTRRENIYLLVHLSIVFLLSTLYMVGLLGSTRIAFVQDLGTSVEITNWAQSMQYVTQILLMWACDLVNLWRCATVYKGSRVPVWLASTIPSQLYLAMFVLGILSLAEMNHWVGSNPSNSFPMMIVTFAFNMLVTLFVAGRLLFCRYQRRKNTLSGRRIPSVSLTTIFVESGALAGIFTTIYLVVFALGSGIVGEVVAQMLPIVQAISTLLIVLRVAQDEGWRLEMPSANEEMVESALQLELETADRRRTGPPMYVELLPEGHVEPLPAKRGPLAV